MKSFLRAAAAAIVLSTQAGAVTAAGEAPPQKEAPDPAVAPDPAPSPSPARSAPVPKAPAAPKKRNIAGPGDYAIRETLVRHLGRDPEITAQPYTIILVNGGAVFSGSMNSCAVKQRALRIAASVRGVVNVTDEMVVPTADLPDHALQETAADLLKAASQEIGAADLRVAVRDTVATLTGKVRDFKARVRAEEITGSVLGITRIANQVRVASAPSGTDDLSIAQAIQAYMGDFRNYSYPSEIKATVDGGRVTLTGRVGLFIARQVAGVMTGLVGGVTAVDNRLKVDLTLGPVDARVTAAPAAP